MLSKWFIRTFDPENEGATGGGASDFATADSPALNLDSASSRLAEIYNQATKLRDDSGRFTAKAQEAEAGEDDTKVVDIQTGKPPEKGEAEAAAETGEDDEDLEFELAGEEGAEPVRRKLTELWEGYEEAQKLRGEVEKLTAQTREVPAELTQTMQQALEARGQYLQGLEAVEKFLSPQPPNKSLIDPNSPNYHPEAYYAQLEKFEQDTKALQAIKAEREQLSKQQEDQQATLYKAHIAREHQALERAWPEFTKAETKAQVRSTLKDVYGFTDEEIAGIPDHRQMLVIRDAIELRALKAQQEKAVKVVRQKPKLVKGGARKTTDSKATARTNAMAKLQATGSMDAAAAAIKGLL